MRPPTAFTGHIPDATAEVTDTAEVKNILPPAAAAARPPMTAPRMVCSVGAMAGEAFHATRRSVFDLTEGSCH